MHEAGQLNWMPGPPSLPEGVEVAILEGDFAKPGPFTVMMRWPTDYRVPAHTHPGVERVTVVSGTVFVSVQGPDGAMQTRDLSPGSYVLLPANTISEVWTETGATLVLNGTGPWGIHYVNPEDDPRNRRVTQR